MNRFLKLLPVLATLLFAGFSVSAVDGLFKDDVIAKATGVEVKRSELENVFISYRANLAAKGGGIPEQKRREVERTLLDRLLFTRILLAKATDVDKETGKAKSSDIIDAQIEAAGSREKFELQVIALGLTVDQFNKQLEEQAVSEQVVERMLKDEIGVSDAAVRTYYDEHQEEFTYPESVRAAHILIATNDRTHGQPLSEGELRRREQLARTLVQRARTERDFAQLVKEHSEDLGSKDTGGEYTFSRGRMVPEFEAAAFSMKPGQVSDVVRSRFGFHIIKLLEKLPPKVEPFENVSTDIKANLELVEIQKRLNDLKTRLFAENDAEIVDPELKGK